MKLLPWQYHISNTFLLFLTPISMAVFTLICIVMNIFQYQRDQASVALSVFFHVFSIISNTFRHTHTQSE